MFQIADFGLSQLIDKGQRLTKVCGTWAYAAPEMAEANSGGYDCKFDTWSFGVILFVVLCGYHPFDPEGGLPVPEVGGPLSLDVVLSTMNTFITPLLATCRVSY